MPDIMKDVKRAIPGCEHDIARMSEWCLEGACPICLTADGLMKNVKIAALERQLAESQAQIRLLRDAARRIYYRRTYASGSEQMAACDELCKAAGLEVWRWPLNSGSCEWTWDTDGFWRTGCGDAFAISNEDSLAENDIFYCHKCGKPIKEEA